MIYYYENYVKIIQKNIDIVDLINDFIPIIKIGNRYVGLCPFHEEHTPSFTINKNNKYFYCFGCKTYGDVFQFIKKYKSFTFTNSVIYIYIKYRLKELGNSTLQEKTSEFNDIKYNKYIYNNNKILKINFDKNTYGRVTCVMNMVNIYFKTNLNENAQKYLNFRNITSKIIDRFDIGFAPNKYNNLIKNFKYITNNINLLYKGGIIARKNNIYNDLFYYKIIFPIKNILGNTIGFAGRSINNNFPKYINSKDTCLFNKRKMLYGLYESIKINKKIKNLIIVEGYFDVLTLHQHNITNVVGIMGTSLTYMQLNLLFSYVNTIILCTDADFAGYLTIKKTIKMYNSIKSKNKIIRILKLSDGFDPDSYIQTFGKNEFLKKIKNHFI